MTFLFEYHFPEELRAVEGRRGEVDRGPGKEVGGEGLVPAFIEVPLHFSAVEGSYFMAVEGLAGDYFYKVPFKGTVLMLEGVTPEGTPPLDGLVGLMRGIRTLRALFPEVEKKGPDTVALEVIIGIVPVGRNKEFAAGIFPDPSVVFVIDGPRLTVADMEMQKKGIPRVGNAEAYRRVRLSDLPCIAFYFIPWLSFKGGWNFRNRRLQKARKALVRGV